MSSSYPYLGTMPIIDQAIQEGRGAAAAVIGQPFNVFRLTSATNSAIVSGAPVIANFPARIRRTTQKVVIENTVFDLLVFEATCDNRSLVLGDVLQETGYEAQGALYTYAQRRPTRETLWVRTEFNCAITRPYSRAGRQAQMPTSGGVVNKSWSGSYKANEQILTLTSGFYSFQSTGTEASVQCGLQPLNRIKDPKGPDIPTAFYREHFLCYVPDLPGEQLQELDIINFPNSDRYEVALVYNSPEVGLTGNICIVEKLGV